MSIPKHIRENFERTEGQINRLRGVSSAIEIVAHDHVETSNSDELDALLILIGILKEVAESLDRAHAMEWVGHGGKSLQLNAEEKAKARGEAEPVN